MSYDKNTIDISFLDVTKGTLDELDVEYTITYLGEAVGKGVNDIPEMVYQLRKLEYRDKVVMERMERTYDCDSDDLRVSHIFEKGEEPKEWPLEIFKDEEDFVAIEEFHED